MSTEAHPPRLPLVLGLAGLVPFVVLAAAWRLGFAVPIIGAGEPVRMALAVYAVAILSFLGGVRWGIAIGQEDGKGGRDFVLSVLPALMAWAAFGAARPADLWWLCATMVAWGLMDYGMACRTVAPEWYGRLRLGLSAVAALALGLAAAG